MSKYSWQRIKAVFRNRKNKQLPVIISSHQHNISNDDISPNALKVLHRLQSLKHVAFLVGGSVRDLLLRHQPKDFDVVTNVPPETVRQIFRNSRLIGRRFRLAHVYFRNEIIEVSTFRANVAESYKDQRLLSDEYQYPTMLMRDNAYGTIEEDAWRRDFTINALYYNVVDSTVVDYTGGVKDLAKRTIRMIGDATQRFHEDPVRLLRAIRMAAKLNFNFDPSTQKPLLCLHNLLSHVPPSRLFDEVLKLFFTGNAYVTYQLMIKTGYMTALFPASMEALNECNSCYQRLFELAMSATDERFERRKLLNPGFLLAVLLWPVVQALMARHQEKYGHLFPALHYGINEALQQQSNTLLIPRRLRTMMRSVWVLQYHLQKRRSRRVNRIFYHRYFRAAFDFMLLRMQAGEPLQELVSWWQAFRVSHEDDS